MIRRGARLIGGAYDAVSQPKPPRRLCGGRGFDARPKQLVDVRRHFGERDDIRLRATAAWQHRSKGCGSECDHEKQSEELPMVHSAIFMLSALGGSRIKGYPKISGAQWQMKDEAGSSDVPPVEAQVTAHGPAEAAAERQPKADAGSGMGRFIG